MADENVEKGNGAVKSYLNFIDANVLFKKPVSCLFAICSLLIPVFFLIQIIQYGIFRSQSGRLIAGALLTLAVLLFAGIFGALIWWHRRINRDEGQKWYPNFRRFIQTFGEWTATMFAIVFFLGILVLWISSGNEYYYYAVESLLPFSGGRYLLQYDVTLALYGLVIGFLIIIATKIVLFLLDPFVWLVKQIWGLIVRVVLYFYRFVLKVFEVFEKNAPVWIGVNWLIALIVVCCGLFPYCKLLFNPYINISLGFLIGAAATVALGLAFMGFLIVKRKVYE